MEWWPQNAASDSPFLKLPDTVSGEAAKERTGKSINSAFDQVIGGEIGEQFISVLCDNQVFPDPDTE